MDQPYTPAAAKRRAAAAVPVAPRLPELKGKRIALVDNSKLNADLFLSRLSEILTERGAVIGHKVRKFAPKDHLAKSDFEKLAQCDAIVLCFGDCGTSTSINVAD